MTTSNTCRVITRAGPNPDQAKSHFFLHPSDRDSIATLLYLSEWRGLTVSFSLCRVLLKHRNMSGFLLSIVTGKNLGKGKGSVEAAMPSVASVTRTRARCRIRYAQYLDSSVDATFQKSSMIRVAVYLTQTAGLHDASTYIVYPASGVAPAFRKRSPIRRSPTSSEMMALFT